MSGTPQHKPARSPAAETGGLIVDEFKDLSSPMGIVYYKVGNDFTGSGAVPRPSLIFSRCHSLIEVAVSGTAAPFLLDALATLIVPAGAGVKLRSVTALSQLAVLCPGPGLLKKTARTYKIPVKPLLGVFGRTRTIVRTNWLNEIIHRLIFERVEAGNSSNEATAFLETEIVKEIYYTSEAFKPSQNVFNLDKGGLYDNVPVLKRALNYIETHLFEEVTLNELARRSLTSEATLLRVFNKEFSKTPANYITDRRLDEALALLRNKKYSISEISGIIGYGTVSGFIAAFGKRFKATPLAWRNARGNSK